MTQKFEPKDPDFRSKVESSFARQNLMKTLGITIEKVDPGRVTLVMPFDEALTQQHGFVHAGAVGSALDSACGYAAHSLMPPEAAVLTAEYKINLLSPAKGSIFRFEGMVIKPGRTLTFCEGHAYGLQDGEDRLIATMSATIIAIYDRAGIKH